MYFLCYFIFCTYTQKFWGSSFSSFRGLRVFVLEVFVFETPENQELIWKNSTKTFQTQIGLYLSKRTTPMKLISEFSRIYEVCFPLKVIKGKQMNKFYSPWLSRGLLKSINKKNRLYKKLVQSPTTSCELKYKAYKNKLNHLIRIAKHTYYDSKLEEAKNDLRTTWKLLNEVINKRKNNPSLPSSFQSDGKTITDPMDIADRFCKYFTNIGPNLASAIPTVNSATFRSFLGSRDYPPIILKPTDARELESICSLFSPRKAPG